MDMVVENETGYCIQVGRPGRNRRIIVLAFWKSGMDGSAQDTNLVCYV